MFSRGQDGWSSGILGSVTTGSDNNDRRTLMGVSTHRAQIHPMRTIAVEIVRERDYERDSTPTDSKTPEIPCRSTDLSVNERNSV